MKNKYEEFYYDVDMQNYPIGVYWDLYDKSPLEALNKYEGNIFCPLCKLAPLTVVKGNERRYMKVIENNMNKHKENCSYRLNKATKKETEYFYSDLDKTDIQSRLVGCMNKMLKKRSSKDDEGMKNINTGTYRTGREDFLDIETIEKKKKYLPHKSLYSEEFDTENDVIKIYYGKCALYLHEYIPEGEIEVRKYYLKILNIKTRRVICDVSISTYVYRYLEEIFSVVPKEKEKAQIFYVCFAGYMGKNKYSYSCKLKDSRLIVIEKEK